MAASTATDLTTYGLKQAKQDFDNARQKIVPDGWEEYVESENKGDWIKIWRKADSASGLYLYKVIGKLEGISVEDFEGVVGNLDYRCSWDIYTHSLSVVDTADPVVIDDADTEKKTDTGAIIQWRVKFNFPFIGDREYLFTRHKAVMDDVVIFIDRQSESHDKYPPKKGITRVAGYNNAICLVQEGTGVIMGQDYLTALDLRMSLPNWLINWAAGAGVKGMLSLYRDAIKGYPGWKEKQQKTN